MSYDLRISQNVFSKNRYEFHHLIHVTILQLFIVEHLMCFFAVIGKKKKIFVPVIIVLCR